MNNTNRDLKFTPIGGVDEIGANMALISKGDKHFLIDCGILFPDSDLFGINFLVPSFDILRDKNIQHIYITHGHEDHIGALPILLKEFPGMTIHATNFTAKLIEAKFSEESFNPKIMIVNPEESQMINGMKIDYIHVNHSIPETFGLLVQDIDTSTCLFYVSDFKVDFDTPYEAPFDFEKLQDLSKQYNHRYLFIDSTNALLPGKSTSEAQVIPVLKNIFESYPQRLFLTLFSSNIHRVKTVLDLAKEQKRKVALSGKSLLKYISIAQDADLLSKYQNVLIDSKDAKQYKDPIILLTGCQGDFFGALKRLANSSHADFTVTEDDIIIFSSKVIPGNETNIVNIQNEFSRVGAEIITTYDADVHASGHARQEDIKMVIDRYNPNHLIPIHGEALFLKRHSQWLKTEYPHMTTHLIFNYDQLSCGQKARVKKGEMQELQYVHGNRVYIEKTQVSIRRKLATQGLLSIVINDAAVLDVELVGLPLWLEEEKTNLIDQINLKLNSEFKKKGTAEKAEAVRILARRFFEPSLGYRPLALVQAL